ncbi:MAG: M28 family peptidase [Brachybacterium tyrofermentans]|uniref:M28 family peptidase n=1 Tax=Brachybacterium tyrofermentans TaxID=47848 RepID=UPI000A1ADC62|nr:M28 family peptidase [Brachybacterium tyrofermentans]SLN04981.1 Peptidase, M20/M25/M40 family [Corynebacterium xerosis]
MTMRSGPDIPDPTGPERPQADPDQEDESSAEPSRSGAARARAQRPGRGRSLLVRGQIPLLLVALALVVALGFASRGVTAAQGTDAPADVFSAARASQAAAAVVAEPRPVGSAANARAHEELADQLTELGFTTDTQESIGLRAMDDEGVAGYTRNLLGVRPGTDPTGTIVLATHIDSVPRAPGAADAGVGVATILESIRALGPEAQRNDLVVLLVDGEERGLLGAQAYLDERAEELTPPVVVLNHEARGISGRPVVTRTNGPMHDVLGAMPHPEFESFTDALFEIIPNDTDFTVYRAAGWWGMDMAIIDDAWAYHSPQDDAAHLDQNSLQHYGDLTLALTRDLAGRDLGALEEGSGGDPVQTTAPWGIVGIHPLLLTVLALCAPIALLAVILVERRRGRLTLLGVALGVVAGTLGLALAVAAAVVTWQLASAATPQMLSQTTREPVRAELFLLADLVAGAVGVACCWVLARLLIGRAALLTGAGLAMTALLAALALYSPALGSSMIPPAILAAAGALLATMLPAGPALAIRVLALLPTAWMLGTQVSALMEFGIASSAGGLAGTAVVGLGAAAPLFLGRGDASLPSRRPHRLLIPVLPAVITVGLVVGGTAWTQAAPEPVQERVDAHVDGATGATTWEASGTTAWGQALDGVSATSDVPLPMIEVADAAGTPSTDGTRRVRLLITSPREAAQLELSPSVGGLEDVSIDGRSLESGNPLTGVQIVGVPQGEAVTVEATVPESAELTLLETTYDPSIAGGWKAPGDDVSLMQPRVQVALDVPL